MLNRIAIVCISNFLFNFFNSFNKEFVFNFTVQLNLELSEVGLAAISSSFCSQLAQVHQHVTQIINKQGNNVSNF